MKIEKEYGNCLRKDRLTESYSLLHLHLLWMKKNNRKMQEGKLDFKF